MPIKPPATLSRRALIWLTIALIAGIFLWLLSPVLTPFLLGAILAYILLPGVTYLSRHRVPRGIAALLMMILFLIILTFLILLILFVIQKEGPEIQQQLPLLLIKLHASLEPKLAQWGININLDFSTIKNFVSAKFAASAGTVMGTLLASLRTSGNVAIAIIGNIVMVPLVLFYLLYDWHRIWPRIQSLIPRRRLDKTVQILANMDRMLSQYLRGQLLVMGILAVYYSLFLWLAGFEIALPVGIFTGLAIFIPYIGYGTGLILALLAALLQFGNWYGFAMVAAIYGVGQIIESFYLTPRIVGERIGLHPLGVIFALLAFGQLFGFFGILLALPASAILMAGIQELKQSYYSSSLYKN